LILISSIAMRAILLAGVVAIGCGEEGDPDCVSRGSPEPAHMHDDGEGSHQGRSCMDSGCHRSGDLGPNAPAYVFAGTVFKPDEVTPQAGVTVRLTPFDNSAPITVVTDVEGNFYLEAGPGVTNPFPSIPDVSACPNTETMIEGALDPSYGNCNANGCHELGGGIGPGAIVIE
jgi:hypothetical protein